MKLKEDLDTFVDENFNIFFNLNDFFIIKKILLLWISQQDLFCPVIAWAGSLKNDWTRCHCHCNWWNINLLKTVLHTAAATCTANFDLSFKLTFIFKYIYRFYNVDKNLNNVISFIFWLHKSGSATFFEDQYLHCWYQNLMMFLNFNFV